MAVELVRHLWCDLCLTEDVNKPGDTYRIGIGELTRVLDLCEEHAEPVLTLKALLSEHGRKLDGTAPKPTTQLRVVASEDGRERVKCPGCEWTGLQQSLYSHAQSAHGVSLGELRGEKPQHPCPYCGKHFTSKQGVAVHVNKSHPGLAWPPEPTKPQKRSR